MIFLPLVSFLILTLLLIVWFVSSAVLISNKVSDPFVSPIRCIAAVTLPSIFAYYGLKKKSLSSSGAQIGFVIGFIMSVSSFNFFTCLLVFFILGSKVTKWRSNLKNKFEENFKEGGQRNWLQVICNGGVAAIYAILYSIDNGCRELPIDFSKHYSASWLSTGLLGALACCCGDTFASEIGTVVGNSRPRLITNFKTVPKGTNGGISLVGMLASLLGGLLIGFTFFFTNYLLIDDKLSLTSVPQWPVIILGGLAGLLGSLVDSFLGATLQYSGICKKRKIIVENPGNDIVHISGMPFLDNHNVNLISSFITSIVTSFTAYYFYGKKKWRL